MLSAARYLAEASAGQQKLVTLGPIFDFTCLTFETLFGAEIYIYTEGTGVCCLSLFLLVEISRSSLKIRTNRIMIDLNIDKSDGR